MFHDVTAENPVRCSCDCGVRRVESFTAMESVFPSKTSYYSFLRISEEKGREPGLCYYLRVFEQIIHWIFDLRINVFAQNVLCYSKARAVEGYNG